MIRYKKIRRYITGVIFRWKIVQVNSRRDGTRLWAIRRKRRRRKGKLSEEKSALSGI